MSFVQDKPIRVAQVIGKMVSGGVESVVFNYYRHIDHRQVQFDFYIDADSTVAPPEDVVAMGARFVTIPPYKKLLSYMRALFRHFKENNYTIVHSHMNTLSVFSLCAAWLAGVPARIAHSHSTAGKGETMRNILKYTLRPFAKVFATDYFACSEYAGRWLFGSRCFDRGKVTVLRNAIDTQKYAFDAQVRDAVRRELGIGNRFVIGHVGRFMYQKNHDFLIDIFHEIAKEEPNALLLLVGDGELRSETEEKAARLGLCDKLRFLGIRKDVDRLYQGMDCFVLPSRYEGLGLVAVEAQASGLPVVMSKAVPIEAVASEDAYFLDLSAGAEDWAKKIIVSWQIRRDKVDMEAWDIGKMAGVLEKWYQEKR